MLRDVVKIISRGEGMVIDADGRKFCDFRWFNSNSKSLISYDQLRYAKDHRGLAAVKIRGVFYYDLDGAYSLFPHELHQALESLGLLGSLGTSKVNG